MKHEEYVALVLAGDYPRDRCVPLPERFENENGVIENLLFGAVGCVSIISSRRGVVRSNHYHKTDWHFLYVSIGRVLYFERPIGEKRTPHPEVFSEGEMFFTPPGVEHAVLFDLQSAIVSMSKNARSHAEHEADVVRVEVLSRKAADLWLMPEYQSLYLYNP